MRKQKLTKNQRIAIIGTIAFAIIGLLCLVIGYGVRDGWDSVLGWFTSRYASYLYVGAIVLVCLLIGLYLMYRRNKDE